MLGNCVHVCCLCALYQRNILQHFHLLWQVYCEQMAEATQVRLSVEVQLHDLVQVPSESRKTTVTPSSKGFLHILNGDQCVDFHPSMVHQQAFLWIQVMVPTVWAQKPRLSSHWPPPPFFWENAGIWKYVSKPLGDVISPACRGSAAGFPLGWTCPIMLKQLVSHSCSWWPQGTVGTKRAQ